jgi:hypothetical protein
MNRRVKVFALWLAKASFVVTMLGFYIVAWKAFIDDEPAVACCFVLMSVLHFALAASIWNRKVSESET